MESLEYMLKFDNRDPGIHAEIDNKNSSKQAQTKQILQCMFKVDSEDCGMHFLVNEKDSEIHALKQK